MDLVVCVGEDRRELGWVMKRLLDSQRETLIPDLDLSFPCFEPWAGLSISLSFFFFFTFLKYRA